MTANTTRRTIPTIRIGNRRTWAEIATVTGAVPVAPVALVLPLSTKRKWVPVGGEMVAAKVLVFSRVPATRYSNVGAVGLVYSEYPVAVNTYTSMSPPEFTPTENSNESGKLIRMR